MIDAAERTPPERAVEDPKRSGAHAVERMRQPAEHAEGTKQPAERAVERAKHSEVFAVEDDVPRLPRGRGLRLSRPQLLRIAGTLIVLVFLVVMQRPCATAVSSFVTGFGEQGSAAAVMPRPGTVDVPAGSASSAVQGAGAAGGAAGSAASGLDTYEHLRPGMTDEEVKAVIDRARVKAAGSSAAP